MRSYGKSSLIGGGGWIRGMTFGKDSRILVTGGAGQEDASCPSRSL